MDKLHLLHTDIELPSQLNNPFCYEPHPLCLLAAEEIKKYVRAHKELLEDAEKGKMFGVLIVDASHHPSHGEPFFLAAYAGLLAGRNDWEWFVPPIFDAQQPDGHFKQTEAKISAINKEIEVLQAPSLREGWGGPLLDLKHQRKEMSNDLLLWLFSQYNLINYKGEVRNVVDIWRDYHNSPKLLRKFPLPPGGTGECCAPKLFQYAYQQGLKPLAIAEFWWGESPKREIRHHFQFYPACNGKCKPILTWQLGESTLNPRPTLNPSRPTPYPPYREGAITSEVDMDITPRPIGRVYVQTLYVDDQIAVVVKPEGLLSVPGNTGETSLYDIMRQRFPNATGPMMVHRLDQATSGIVVVAKTEFAYKHLQRQFEQREVKKRYVAMVQKPTKPTRPSPRPPYREGAISSEAEKDITPRPIGEGYGGASIARDGARGRVSLPLAPDYLDRPRQLVDYENGKPAVTDYEFIGHEGPYFRVLLTPHTGRTHQLRVHCAHQDGLGMPIVGDDLYGFHSDRLYLHAEYLSFTHPLTGEIMEFEKAPDF